MRTVSIIACNNGLGHVKRSCLLYDALVDLGIEVTIYGNYERVRTFIESRKGSIMPIVQNISGLPTGQDYLYAGLDSFKDTFKDLSELLDDSLVISDNYFEPFLYNSTGFLLANFLWSDLEDESFGFDIVNQLRTKKCRVLTTKFGKPYFEGALQINLFGAPKEQKVSLGYTLVCKGFGDWNGGFEECLEEFFANDIKTTNDVQQCLYIDRNIPYQNWFSDYDVRILEQGISEDIIANADRIIGRPSLGILTDSLAAKVPFLPVFSPADLESAHNDSVLTKIYQSNGILNLDCSLMRTKMKNIDFGLGGEKQLAELIHGELNR
jgi:hypothetical protein